jgi:hypothetical protein
MADMQALLTEIYDEGTKQREEMLKAQDKLFDNFSKRSTEVATDETDFKSLRNKFNDLFRFTGLSNSDGLKEFTDELLNAGLNGLDALNEIRLNKEQDYFDKKQAMIDENQSAQLAAFEGDEEKQMLQATISKMESLFNSLNK